MSFGGIGISERPVVSAIEGLSIMMTGKASVREMAKLVYKHRATLQTLQMSPRVQLADSV